MKKYVKTSLLILALCLFKVLITIPGSLFGLEVDIDELRRLKKVQFENYEGEHKIINLAKDIRAIGKTLSRGIAGSQRYRKFNLHMKYSIIHAISDKEPEKLSADIFSIDKDAKVDHIKNIRRIISGFLQDRYKYNRKNSDALALFLSYYNALNRGNIEYITNVYKKAVTKNINTENVGIALKYSEWPGNTKMLIPLTSESKRGDIDMIDPFEIADEGVRELVKKDLENIDERKDMVDIQKETVEKEKKEIDEQKKELAEKKEQLQNIQDKQQAEQLQKEVTKLEQGITQGEKDIAQKTEQIRKEEISITRDELTKKEYDLNLREDGLRDTKEVSIYADKLFYMKVRQYSEGGHYINDMFRIDLKTMTIELKSPLNKIAGRKFDIFSDGIALITKGASEEEHFLTLLDRDTLNIKKTGENNVFWRSFVRIKDDHIYAILKSVDGRYYLGKFNTDLKLVFSSDIEIKPDNMISFHENKIFITQHDGNILVLSSESLTRMEIIESNMP